MRRAETMAPLNLHQLRALDHLVFEGGQLDINALLMNLIDKGELGPYYKSLMGPNSVSFLRTCLSAQCYAVCSQRYALAKCWR